jgi:hypothetical protein
VRGLDHAQSSNKDSYRCNTSTHHAIDNSNSGTARTGTLKDSEPTSSNDIPDPSLSSGSHRAWEMVSGVNAHDVQKTTSHVPAATPADVKPATTKANGATAMAIEAETTQPTMSTIAPKMGPKKAMMIDEVVVSSCQLRDFAVFRGSEGR